MNTLDLARNAEHILQQIDQQITNCYLDGVDYSRLAVAREAIVEFLTSLKQGMDYKMDLYRGYGVLPDIEELQELVDEIGYEQVKLTYGDDLDEVLTEISEWSFV